MIKAKFIYFLLVSILSVNCNTKGNAKSELSEDKTNYSHLPYWNDSMDRYDNTYVDTFSVGGNKYRFVNTDTINNHSEQILQKEVNGKWFKTKTTLEYRQHARNFYHTKDINNDGYNDIVNEIRFDDEVFFFNPKKNDFEDSASHSDYLPDWYLIDSTNNIFCDFHHYKQLCGHIGSTLYTFKGIERIDLFELELYNCNNSSGFSNIITKLILKKFPVQGYDSTEVISEENLSKPIDIEDINFVGKYSNPNKDDYYNYFDYRKYWLGKYKQLLGLK